MAIDPEFQSEAERFGDLLDKADSGPYPEISNLTEEEEIELEELWETLGYDALVGPYPHLPWPVDVQIDQEQQTLFEDVSSPPSPMMTWEQIEDGRPGQLSFPAFIPVPTMAERAFLTLAREWASLAEKTPQGNADPRSADERALSCLLLCVERGTEFTEVACQQMESNRKAAATRGQLSWMNELPWKLCQSANLMSPPSERRAVEELTANLDHHNSSIRCWMMEIGWFVVPWLNPVEASVRLLKNLADTLCGPFMAAGLATRFFEKPESFFDFAKTFKPPAGFEAQYQNRLKTVEDSGILEMQADFWQTEAICRQHIERAVLGLRMRK